MQSNHIIKELSITDINLRIEKEYSSKITGILTDEKLLSIYKNCKSVKKNISELNDILLKNISDEKIRENIINEYILKLIPPGTKGVIRGNIFNKIIKDTIIKLNLDTEKFAVYFEKKCEHYPTSEIPDWYILEKHTNRIIIGMNQLDLWGGGHQINRGSKYIIKEKNNDNVKLLCVICNKIQLKNNKNKVFSLFNVGFTKNTLCYINNLQNIIYSFFNLE